MKNLAACGTNASRDQSHRSGDLVAVCPRALHQPYTSTMTSIGTGYDLSNSVFSPDGRNFQVEYAMKAVENGGTSIGIKAKDGIVLAVEKIVNSKLLVPGRNKRIQTIDRHIGVAYSGLLPDGRHFVNRGRDEAQSYSSIYKTPVGVPALMDRLGLYVQNYTCYNSVRPFGIVSIVGGVDENGPHLYMVEPSGAFWGYSGAASGKGRQTAKPELEKLDFELLTVREAVKHAARIIHQAHEDNKDKDYELEISWCSLEETGGQHQFVPEDLLQEAIKLAQEEDDEEDEEEDEEDTEMAS
ncbi:N-terminal nucleophile aminohydrolase [Metschnikowia bicuspidata var. bicuspidata NRRL YB-4993]|uniref:Proteasome subunit alpha type n=1 Tax=Metschnikowia bicuspidata var. bicuspidata NRRL YB-4993 TaxID=869754 RepID=A0A1A0H6S2_9ASCO|nr:N-terminal nucleophile aminohydrolase [Metschnikowia bicuspidata var. bicuspidata NRRL YB-4993]OBA19655.1 N-terminal nucleophile aminohydrolase [Metschnikowia bicuspidata var. bicuspidata NRRL YB-4993]